MKNDMNEDDWFYASGYPEEIDSHLGTSQQPEVQYAVYNADLRAAEDRANRARRKSGSAGAEEPKTKRRGCLPRLLPALLLLILLLVLLTVGWGKLQGLLSGTEQRNGCHTLLIAGTDADGLRTDTIMLLYLDTTQKEAALLSIPRDTLVNLSMSVPKINGVYGAAGGDAAGMEALMEQVANLLGYAPDGYVLVNFDAVVDVVDTLGGVEFDVPVDMYYQDPTQDLYINLQAGLQTLTGEQVLWVLRYRSGYALADLERVSVQRQLVQAMAEQCLNLSTLTRLPALLEIYQENILSDCSFAQLAALAALLQQCDMETTQTLPGQAIWYQGGSYYEVDIAATVQLLGESFNPLQREITAQDLAIAQVVNGQIVTP